VFYLGAISDKLIIIFSNIRVAIEKDLILTETETENETEKERENTNKDTMIQETIAGDMKMIMIMTVLGTGNTIADAMRETTYPTRALHVPQSG
jgi:hypothetical protein